MNTDGCDDPDWDNNPRTEALRTELAALKEAAREYLEENCNRTRRRLYKLSDPPKKPGLREAAETVVSHSAVDGEGHYRMPKRHIEALRAALDAEPDWRALLQQVLPLVYRECSHSYSQHCACAACMSRRLLEEHPNGQEQKALDEKLRVSLQGYPPRDEEDACDAIDDAIGKAVTRMNDPARHPKETP